MTSKDTIATIQAETAAKSAALADKLQRLQARVDEITAEINALNIRTADLYTVDTDLSK